MDANGFSCPEDSNSTDCLLRALLRLQIEQKQADDAKPDWDSLTFAFTLLLGVLASTFALTSIRQAIVAAGRGQRQTNSRAIGKWSNETTKKWSWSEMSFQTTAWTPIIRQDTLMQLACSEEATLMQDTMSSFDDMKSTLPWDRKPKDPLNDYQFAATWLRFFNHVGLKRIGIPVSVPDRNPVVADCLPSDLVAAPAYAQVGAIVLAAAVAGMEWNITSESDFPIIIGDDCQFEFYSHPLLGIVGAFANYDKNASAVANSSCISTLSSHALKMAIQHAGGFIEVGGSVLDSVNDSDMFENHIRKELLLFQGSDCFIPDYRAFREHPVSIMRLFLADTPGYAPALFPKKLRETTKPLTYLALNGHYWAQVPLRSFSRINLLRWPEGHGRPTWKGFRWDPVHITRPLERRRTATFESYQRRKIVESHWLDAELYEHLEAVRKVANARTKEANQPLGYSLAIHMCNKLLANPCDIDSWFSTARIRTKQGLRWLVLEQLKEVDRWLNLESIEKEVRERIVTVCNTSLVLSRVDEMARETTEDIRKEHLPGANSKPPKEDSAYHRHSGMLQKLRSLLDDLDLNENTFNASLCMARERKQNEDNEDGEKDLMTSFLDTLITTSKPEDLDVPESEMQSLALKINKHDSFLMGLSGAGFNEPWKFFNTHRILDRLGTIVVYHSKPESHWPLYERFEQQKDDKETRDLDDVILFRCLLIDLLFKTAPDNSGMLESGIWERIVPII